MTRIYQALKDVVLCSFAVRDLMSYIYDV